mmetsp:Transcript_17262/g.67172  ORF Transcript_17262/g.67172 Transcript_17262/m.67172 type:complete len:221 (+) Transcript_17262:160-822(+)
MLDSYLRHVKEAICLPLARLLGGYASPLQITVVGFLVGMLSPFLVAAEHYRWGCLCWAANRLLDGLDGVVARVTNRQTDFGGYLDIVCDFIVYSALPIGLVVARPSDISFTILAVMESTFFVNGASQFYLATLLEKRQLSEGSEFTSIDLPVGLIEGTETMVLLTLAIVFHDLLDLWFSIFAVGVTINIVFRVWWAYTVLGTTPTGQKDPPEGTDLAKIL